MRSTELSLTKAGPWGSLGPMRGKMLKKSLSTGIFALLLLCAVSAPQAQQRLVLGGKAVVMVADAVYLFPGMGSRVLAVAGADQGLGVFLSAIDPTFGAKPVLDRNAGTEVYASFKPDAVIMKSSMKKTSGPALDALGIRQVYLSLETPEDYIVDIKALGSFLGMEKRAAQLSDFFSSRLSLVESRAAAAKGLKPRVLLVQAGAGSDTSWEVPPASWMQTRLVDISGGQAVWKNANPGSGWARVNVEQVAAWNPEFVFVVDYRGDSAASARSFASDSRLARVAAVASGKVFGFPQDFYSWDQPDTRWILGLQWLASKLHPEIFAGLSMREEARTFFSTLYGMDESAFLRLIEPRLAGNL